jgi:hypothetical protein
MSLIKEKSFAVSSSFPNFDLFFKFLCVDCCREEVGVILKSPDQKTRGFLVQIALPQ